MFLTAHSNFQGVMPSMANAEPSHRDLHCLQIVSSESWSSYFLLLLALQGVNDDASEGRCASVSESENLA